MKHYTQRITPEQHIYHISYRKNRESILRDGLKANSNENIGYSNAVFAHNCTFPTIDWYPCVIDHYMWNWKDGEGFINMDPTSKELIVAFKEMYDIWRIDSVKLKKQWFIDTVGELEFKGSLYKQKKLYILCFGDIPVECIQLCPELKTEYRLIQMKTGWINMNVPCINVS